MRTNGGLDIVAVEGDKDAPAEFMVLHDGQICFEGTSTELLAAGDEYLKDMLFMTLPPW